MTTHKTFTERRDCGSCGGIKTLIYSQDARGYGYCCEACGDADGEPWYIPEGLDCKEAMQAREREAENAVAYLYGDDY